MTVPVSVLVADVEWVDRRGAALVCGRMVTRADIRDHETLGDRRPDGRLTAGAKERIAEALAERLEARPFHHVRDCNG